jgi:hypothetical protein
VGEGRRVLGRVGGAGEGLEGFHRHDPVADAGAETFGVERSLYIVEIRMSATAVFFF